MATGAKKLRAAFTMGVRKSILGAKVINAEREDLGTIEDLILDSRDDRVAYAILSFGGFLGLGDKHFAIPWEALSFDVSEKVAVLSIDKDRLSNAPGFDKDRWPDMTDSNWGAQVSRHYGYEPREESTEPPQKQQPSL
jgi:sporulation protein YlmC with PRC-barrel domain